VSIEQRKIKSQSGEFVFKNITVNNHFGDEVLEGRKLTVFVK
jgi:hypothetical protein